MYSKRRLLESQMNDRYFNSLDMFKLQKTISPNFKKQDIIIIEKGCLLLRNHVAMLRHDDFKLYKGGTILYIDNEDSIRPSTEPDKIHEIDELISKIKEPVEKDASKYLGEVNVEYNHSSDRVVVNLAIDSEDIDFDSITSGLEDIFKVAIYEEYHNTGTLYSLSNYWRTIFPSMTDIHVTVSYKYGDYKDMFLIIDSPLYKIIKGEIEYA